MKRKQVYYNQDTSKLQEQKAYGEFQDIPSVPESSASYKVYTALLTQTGTSNPVVTSILQNTIGDIVWTRHQIGQYLGTLAGAFTPQKTIVFIQNNQDVNLYGIVANQNTQDTVLVGTEVPSSGASGDDMLSDTPIEIKVYL